MSMDGKDERMKQQLEILAKERENLLFSLRKKEMEINNFKLKNNEIMSSEIRILRDELENERNSNFDLRREINNKDNELRNFKFDLQKAQSNLIDMNRVCVNFHRIFFTFPFFPTLLFLKFLGIF